MLVPHVGDTSAGGGGLSWKLKTHLRSLQLSLRVIFWKRGLNCTKGSHLHRRKLELELGIRVTGSNGPWNNAGGGRKPKMGWRFISRG